MFKRTRKALIEAFTGFNNRDARDVADSMGNRSADAHSIAQVYETLRNQHHEKAAGIRGFFELAAQAWKSVRVGGGSTGRPYKPTFGFMAPAPEPR